MKDILLCANELKDEIVKHRRTLHKIAEVGSFLPQTRNYVFETLTSMGYKPKLLCESGIVATIEKGSSKNCVLLRADMDALAINERTALPYRCTKGKMHACGHDMHTAMLLGAAKLLKNNDINFSGNIKLVFQPNEEGLCGAKELINAGVLTNPTPSFAFALHVHSGTPSGLVLWREGVFMAGCTLFQITVLGKACHGAMPEMGVDPITISSHICLALQELISRELSPTTPVAITIGKIQGGTQPNQIPNETIIEGSIRTFDEKLSDWIFHRIEEISLGIAKSFRGSASVTSPANAPPLNNDETLIKKTADSLSSLIGNDNVIHLSDKGMGSEDFSHFTKEIPSAYFLLGAGTKQEHADFGKPMHNEQVIFNEDILPIGAAIYAHLAITNLQGSNQNLLTLNRY